MVNILKQHTGVPTVPLCLALVDIVNTVRIGVLQSTTGNTI